jgi:hypothetical protein
MGIGEDGNAPVGFIGLQGQRMAKPADAFDFDTRAPGINKSHIGMVPRNDFPAGTASATGAQFPNRIAGIPKPGGVFPPAVAKHGESDSGVSFPRSGDSRKQKGMGQASALQQSAQQAGCVLLVFQKVEIRFHQRRRPVAVALSE